jgi:hypothetical protein
MSARLVANGTNGLFLITQATVNRITQPAVNHSADG